MEFRRWLVRVTMSVTLLAATVVLAAAGQAGAARSPSAVATSRRQGQAPAHGGRVLRLAHSGSVRPSTRRAPACS